MKKILLIILSFSLAFCARPEKNGAKEGLSLKSPVFKYGQQIPAKYTCDGENISPEIVWNGVPPGAKSLVLTCEDLAGITRTFIHWVIYNIPPSAKGLPQNVPQKVQLPDGSEQAYNTRSQLGYLGPCPGSATHQYVFRLYALDFKIENEPPLTAGKVLSLMEGHVIAKAAYMGTYR
jgi:hypothetical protein